MGNHERQFGDAELSAMLRSLDRRPPRTSADVVMGRVRRRRTRNSALLATCALVSMATIAMAAVPGTALNGFVRGLRGVNARRDVGSMRTSPIATASPSAAGVARGIAFVPGEHANIVFRSTQTSGELRVRVADVTSVRLTQTTEGDARYELTPNGIEVGNEGSMASYELVLPTALPRASVRVGRVTIVWKNGAELSCGEKRTVETSCVLPVRP